MPAATRNSGEITPPAQATDQTRLGPSAALAPEFPRLRADREPGPPRSRTWLFRHRDLSAHPRPWLKPQCLRGAARSLAAQAIPAFSTGLQAAAGASRQGVRAFGLQAPCAARPLEAAVTTRW